ncbi:MAG: hypothetical protein ACKVOT_14165 [Polaromonas sp.]
MSVETQLASLVRASSVLAEEISEKSAAVEQFASAAAAYAVAANLSRAEAASAAAAASASEAETADKVRASLLAGPDGAKLTGHLAEGDGAVATTLQQVLGETNVVLRRMNAALIADIQSGAASISAVAGLWAADQHGPSTLVAGAYRVDANLTFTKRVTFMAGARLVIAAGVTVTFHKQVQAHGGEQIFYGAGAVAGLKKCKVEWFAGDNTDVQVDSLALIQKAMDATRSHGDVRWVHGNLFITGATPVLAAKGQRIRGYGRFSSALLYTTSACNGIHFTDQFGGGLIGMKIGWADRAVLPTSGTALKLGDALVKTDDFVINGGFIGVEAAQGSGGSTLHDFNIYDCFEIGLYAHDLNDVFASKFTIVCILDRFTLTGVSGSFSDADTLVGSVSGAVAGSVDVVFDQLTSTLIRAHAFDKNFLPGETITGSVSGATATLASQVVGHRLGGVRLFNKVEAFILSDGDVIGGTYSMTTDASQYAVGNRPAYNKFTNIYFDSADEGGLWNNSVEFDFISCWLSNRPNHGGVLERVENIRFIGGGAVNCAKAGLIISALAKNVRLSAGFAAAGNSTSAPNAYDGIQVEAGATDFHLDVQAGETLGFGTQRYGVSVGVGASDRYSIRGDVTGNATAGIFDGGTGIEKLIDVIGYRTKNKGSATVQLGQTVVQVDHGLPITPNIEDFALIAGSIPSASGVTSWDITAITATSFQIHVNTAPTGQVMKFGWSVRTAGA